jgi:hypothetical protein
LTLPIQFQFTMKIYTFYTPTHRIFHDEWFLPSLHDDIEVVSEQFPQHCPSGAYKSPGWNRCMLDKIDYLIQALDESSDYFIYADCDIQFFNPIANDLLHTIEQQQLDLVAQSDSINERVICAGFFIAKATDTFREVLVTAKELLERNIMPCDQTALNALLKFGANNLKFGLLGTEYFSVHMGNGDNQWQPGQKINMPKYLVMHHANWTVGIDNKLKLMKQVRNAYEKGDGGIIK